MEHPLFSWETMGFPARVNLFKHAVPKNKIESGDFSVLAPILLCGFFQARSPEAVGLF